MVRDFFTSASRLMPEKKLRTKVSLPFRNLVRFVFPLSQKGYLELMTLKCQLCAKNNILTSALTFFFAKSCGT